MAGMDYSFAALMQFLDYAGEKGLINRSTAEGHRAAARKIEGDLTEQESADVREIDPDIVFQRFMNRNRVELGPSTLLEYKRRLSRMVKDFAQWRGDPTAYRPKGTKTPKSGKVGAESSVKSSPPARRPTAKVEASKSEVSDFEKVTSDGAGKQMLNLPYPIRPDVLATIQVPRDMSSEEAARLAAFVRTLAIDFKPGN
jgi:hypothetical protein